MWVRTSAETGRPSKYFRFSGNKAFPEETTYRSAVNHRGIGTRSAYYNMNFRKLDVYKIAILFLPQAIGIADILAPRYAAMADQIRRAAMSIPLNIAEGSGKTSGADQRRYFAIARGSAMECAAIIDACSALTLIEQPQLQEADQMLLSLVRMLSKMCLP